MSVSISDTDKGFIAFRRAMGAMDKSYTKVGIPDGVNGVSKEGPLPAGKLVTYVAANEFGAEAGPSKSVKIPERPALRQAFDMAHGSGQLGRVRAEIVNNVITSRLSVRQALSQLGEYMTGKMKLRVLTLRIPPNAPSTIARKKSNNPLIDTGTYRNSITHREVMA
jgi:hypothetical protein